MLVNDEWLVLFFKILFDGIKYIIIFDVAIILVLVLILIVSLIYTIYNNKE